MPGSEYLTVAQVAEKLQVHPETVTRWIRQGTLRGILLSRRAGYRIEPSDLNRFMDSKERRGTSDKEENSK